MSVFLVTGAAGFIGAEVSAQLLAAGNTVVGVDNLNHSCDPRLKLHRITELSVPLAAAGFQGVPNFHFHALDITNPAPLAELFDAYAFDAVIHLAARAGVRDSLADPAAHILANALGTTRLLEAMRARAVRKLVLASTSSLYAGQPPPFTEDLPANTPLSPYAASKNTAEMMARIYHTQHGFDTAVLRYFTVFGPAGRPDMSVFRFIQKIANDEPIDIYGDGSQTRDWTYVADIARGTIAAATRPIGYEIINLGGGTNPPVPLNAVIAVIEDALGKSALRRYHPFHPADMETTSANIAKAAHLLDWAPQVHWQDGLLRTVAWHRKHHEWLRTLNHQQPRHGQQHHHSQQPHHPAHV
jgi:nucleoside-diphosphate-sugar epimerase